MGRIDDVYPDAESITQQEQVIYRRGALKIREKRMVIINYLVIVFFVNLHRIIMAKSLMFEWED